jgi:hypothetical protein
MMGLSDSTGKITERLAPDKRVWFGSEGKLWEGPEKVDGAEKLAGVKRRWESRGKRNSEVAAGC